MHISIGVVAISVCRGEDRAIPLKLVCTPTKGVSDNHKINFTFISPTGIIPRRHSLFTTGGPDVSGSHSSLVLTAPDCRARPQLSRDSAALPPDDGRTDACAHVRQEVHRTPGRYGGSISEGVR